MMDFFGLRVGGNLSILEGPVGRFVTTICYRGGLGNTARGVCLSTYVYVLSLFLLFFKKKDGSMLRLRGSMGYYRASRGAEKRIRENITHSPSSSLPISREKKKRGGRWQQQRQQQKHPPHTKIARCCLRDTDLFSFPIPFFFLFIFSFFFLVEQSNTQFIYMLCVSSSLLPPSEFHGARWRSVGQTIWEILFYWFTVFERGRKK